jgi:hypothetical protein
MKVVNTGITVLDLNMFKQFLEHHNITCVFVGIHSVRINSFQVDNYIQYAYDENGDDAADLTALLLKYGNLEKAFLKARYSERELEKQDFKQAIGR